MSKLEKAFSQKTSDLINQEWFDGKSVVKKTTRKDCHRCGFDD